MLTGQGTKYGPLFNLFAFPAALDALLPKLLFTAAWIVVAAVLLGLYVRRRRPGWLVAAVACFLLANPYFWNQIPWNGQFDILPAALALLAVHWTLRGKDTPAGVALGAAALLKFYPLFLLPFLAFGQRRSHWRLAASCLATFASGMLMSWAIWGSSAMAAGGYVSETPSKMYSVFRFLRGTVSPLRLVHDAPNVDRWSLPLIVVAGVLVFLLWRQRRRTHPIAAALLGHLTLVTCYRAGLSQYLAFVFLLAVYWVAMEPAAFQKNRRLAWALGSYLGWITLIDALYFLCGSLAARPWSQLREAIGLPTFLLAAWLIAELLVSRPTAVDRLSSHRV